MEVGRKGVLKSGAPFEVVGFNHYTRITSIKIWNKDEIDVSNEWLLDNEQVVNEPR